MLIKENKDKVMRITGSEERLIEYIRGEGITEIERLASVDFKVGAGIEKLVALLNGTLGLKQNTLRERVEMTDEQEEQLYKAMQENRNIVIEGRTATGRSTIINSLIGVQENERIVVLDDRDGCVKAVQGVGLEVSYNEGITLSEMYNLEEILKTKPVRVVVDGMYGKEHSLGLLEAMNRGMSILVTDYPGWEDRLIEELLGMGISRAREIIESKKIIRVELVKTVDNKNKIGSIEEK